MPIPATEIAGINLPAAMDAFSKKIANGSVAIRSNPKSPLITDSGG